MGVGVCATLRTCMVPSRDALFCCLQLPLRQNSPPLMFPSPASAATLSTGSNVGDGQTAWVWLLTDYLVCNPGYMTEPF